MTKTEQKPRANFVLCRLHAIFTPTIVATTGQAGHFLG